MRNYEEFDDVMSGNGRAPVPDASTLRPMSSSELVVLNSRCVAEKARRTAQRDECVAAYRINDTLKMVPMSVRENLSRTIKWYGVLSQNIQAEQSVRRMDARAAAVTDNERRNVEFIRAASRMLDNATYMQIWDEVNRG